ncbi:MAG: hypothetical protein HQM02_03135 [Magnetococcales bacterium]|nr:hypothetical protein [Magnetococcales bacterium]
MSHAKVQTVLKNTDLLLDVEEIRALLTAVLTEKRVVEMRIGRDKAALVAHLEAFREGDFLALSPFGPDAVSGSRLENLSLGTKVTVSCMMGGYALETRLATLETTAAESWVRLSYPGLFRVHSKRQVSRFSTPLDMSSMVEMVGKADHVRGELQDINQEGLSFLGGDVVCGVALNEEVRVRLLPRATEDPPMALTGVLRFAGLERPKGVQASLCRYSVQITHVEDPKTFQRYFNKIKSCSNGLFRSSVMSSESYCFTVAI